MDAESLLAGCEHEIESISVLKLVCDSDCSAYDCEFIALATKLDTQSFTMDKKLLRNFTNHTATNCGLTFELRDLPLALRLSEG